MEQIKSKERDREHEEIRRNDVLEFETSAAKKLVSGEPYNKEDVTVCSEKILRNFRNTHFTYSCIDKFEELTMYIIDISHGEPVDYPRYVLYDKGQGQWVVFSLFLHNDEHMSIHVYYKDSTGDDIQPEVKKLITNKLWNPIFNVHRGQEQFDNYSHGAFAVRNLKHMLQFIPNWESQDFRGVKWTLAASINRDKVDLMVNNVREVAYSQGFKLALRKFIDAIPMKLGNDIDDYLRILKEEASKNNGENMDVQRIEQARKRAFDMDRLKQIQREYKLDPHDKDLILDIEKDYPEEMKKLRAVFSMLDKVKVNEQLMKLLNTLSKMLEINFDQIKMIYDKKLLKQKEKPAVGRLKPTDEKQVIASLKPEEPYATESDLTPLEQLLANTYLGMDEVDHTITPPPPNLTKEQYRQMYQNNPDLVNIERKYHLVKKFYEENWKDQSAKDIMDWAAAMRKKKLGNTDEEICDCIAAMDRAFKIYTKKFRFRDTQILATLVFLHNVEDKGKLVQIQTGEGKTLIVSMIAVIKILQGETVDVITSNSVLAKEGRNESQQMFDLFRVTVSTNNPEDNPDGQFNLGYTADVVYGTISNFQFDYLKEAVEGQRVRVDRKFGVVILDEVDNMLIDNGSHIAKLASPFPGMEYLRYIYIRIWIELHKSIQVYEKQREEELKGRMNSWKKQIMQDRELTEREAEEQYANWMEEMKPIERQTIKDLMKKNLTDIKEMDLLPAHLTKYARNHMEIWTRNAIYAKFDCHEHQQYRLMPNKNGELSVVPIDYMNTGITMKNTIWAHGLHQFVQLKHNLYLTFESLTSSFVSNIGYIKLYQSKNIFGMTGTLGSYPEQNLLRNIYSVEYAKLPTYKPKDFKEVDSILAPDHDWSARLVLEAFNKIDKGRSVLIICETEHDVLTVKKDVEVLRDKGTKFNTRIYMNEKDSETATKKKVEPGEIILATNIAGRGTNFKTLPALEANGGLHVIVGFLPYNRRIEEQAFGRTARQGNKGTAQLVVRESEIYDLNLNKSSNITFDVIKPARDENERRRLKDIDEVMVREINFKDELFKYFAKWHLDTKRHNMTIEYKYFLLDLKEFWAFWLEEKNFTAANIEGTTPEKEFYEFKEQAQKIVDGNIVFNPFYCVALAGQWLHYDELRPKAVQQLNKALEMSGENVDVMAAAYMGLFEASIEDGNQLLIRFKDALAKIIFLSVKVDDAYKDNAKKYLESAKNSVSKELQYLQDNFAVKDDDNADGKELSEVTLILVGKSEDEQDDSKRDENGENELNKAETPNGHGKNIDNDKDKKKKKIDNLFLKHMFSRLQCLNIYKTHIDGALKDINKYSGGVAMAAMDSGYLKQAFEKGQKNEKDDLGLTLDEIGEMRIMGLETMYMVREVHNIPQTVVVAAQAQIGAGIALLAVGWIFVPAAVVTGPAASTLISEGIMDLVGEVLKYKGDDEFKLWDYQKSKMISYSIAIVTLGISAIFTCKRIIKKAIEFCKKISEALRNVEHLKSIAERLANIVDKIKKVLQNRLAVVEFSRMSKWAQMEELRYLETVDEKKFKLLGGKDLLENLRKLNLENMKFTFYLGGYMKSLGGLVKSTLYSAIVENFVEKKIKEWALTPFMDAIQNIVRKKVLEALNYEESFKMKLRRIKQDDFDRGLKEFFKKNDAAEIGTKIATKALKQLKHSLIKWFIVIEETIVDLESIFTYTSKLITYIQENIPEDKENNDPDKRVEQMADKLVKAIVKWCKSVIDRGVSISQKYLEEYYKKEIKPEWENLQSNVNKTVNTDVSGQDDEDLTLVDLGDPDRDMSLEENSEWMGLAKDCPKEYIIIRYRELALRIHPDKNPEDPLATKHFQILNRAYRNLMKQRGFD